MYTVGLDKLESLILYSQQSLKIKALATKILKQFIYIYNNIEAPKRILFFFLVGETKIEKSAKGKVKFIPYSSDTKEIIFGSLLGDGKLEMSPRSVNARFGFIQAEFRKDYFLSVANSLSNI